MDSLRPQVGGSAYFTRPTHRLVSHNDSDCIATWLSDQGAGRRASVLHSGHLVLISQQHRGVMIDFSVKDVWARL